MEKRQNKEFINKKVLIILFSLIVVLTSLILFLNYQKNASVNFLTLEERIWLDRYTGEVILATDPYYPPFDVSDLNGDYTGVSASYINLIENKLNFKFKKNNNTDWDEIVKGFEDGKIDCVSTVSSFVNSTEYLYTDPYIKIPCVIVTAENSNQIHSLIDLNNKRLIEIGKGFHHENFVNGSYQKNIILCSSLTSALSKLNSGEAEILIINQATAKYFVNDKMNNKLYINGSIGDPIGFSIACRPEMSMLCNILNKAIASIELSEQKKINYSWKIYENKMSVSRKFIVIFSILLFAVFITASIFLIWNLFLSKHINEKENELNESKNHVDGIIQSLPFTLFELDSEGKVIRWNISAEILFNKSFDLVKNKFFWESLPELSYIIDNFNYVKKTKKYFSINDQLIFKNKKLIHNLIIHPINNSDGFIVMLEDITSDKLKDQQLFQAQKMECIGMLAGGIAHDFNNLLGGMLGTLSLLKFKVKSNADINKSDLDDFIGIMEMGVNRSSDMIQQLLTLSMKQEISVAPVDLNYSLRHVMKICNNSFDKSIEISSSLSEKPAMVEADPTLIEQSLLNLCINAAHAMTIMKTNNDNIGGILNLSIYEFYAEDSFLKYNPEVKKGNYWVVSVDDTGVGISNESLNKIFDPFYTTKAKGLGSGLGLTMVYNIIKQHSGFITVDSVVGKGCSVKIYLPALVNYNGIFINEAANMEIPHGSGLILIVDDEDIMRRAAASILTEFGYKIMLAENGTAAVEIYKNRSDEIDLVLLDMVMPKKSGLETYRELKEINDSVKVILASGYNQDSRINEAMEAGIAVFIKKPYTMERLAIEVNSLLKA